MNIFKLAWRNLLRNRRRTISTLLTMIVGVIAMLLFGGYDHAVVYGLQTSFVRDGGHLQVQNKDFFEFGSGNPAAYGVRDYRRVMQLIADDPVLKPMLTVVTPTLYLDGIAGNDAAGTSHTVMVFGSEVQGQNRLRQWDDYHFGDGHRRKPAALTGTAPDVAVIGMGVARVLQLCDALKITHCPKPQAVPGKDRGPAMPADLAALTQNAPAPARDPRVELLAATASGAPNIARLRIISAQSQGVKALDDRYVGMHLAQAQQLLYGQGEPMVSAIVLQLQHTRQIPQARARLQQLFATTLRDQPLTAYSYDTLQPQYGQITGMFGSIFGFIALLIACVTLFTIGNTMNMVVLERTGEIGTLRAMGLKRAGIRRLFLCEGVLLGGAGSVLGVLAALLTASLINHAGLSWTPPGSVDPSPIAIILWGENGLTLGTILILTLTAALSSWWPARRAAALDIVDALRHA